MDFLCFYFPLFCIHWLMDKDIVNVPPRYYWPIPFETLSKSKGKITNGYGLAQE